MGAAIAPIEDVKIRFIAADHDIGAQAAGQGVCASTALQPVVAAAAGQRVVAGDQGWLFLRGRAMLPEVSDARAVTAGSAALVPAADDNKP